MTTPSAEAKQLPEVERYTITYDCDGGWNVNPNPPDFARQGERNMSPSSWKHVCNSADEMVLASAFDAHTTALKEAVRMLRGYVRHHSTCECVKGYLLPIALKEDTGCTCGASQALADTEQGEK